LKDTRKQCFALNIVCVIAL